MKLKLILLGFIISSQIFITSPLYADDIYIRWGGETLVISEHSSLMQRLDNNNMLKEKAKNLIKAINQNKSMGEIVKAILEIIWVIE